MGWVWERKRDKEEREGGVSGWVGKDLLSQVVFPPGIKGSPPITQLRCTTSFFLFS
jgi:hypothetical protein